MSDWLPEIRRSLSAAGLDPAREAEIALELDQHLSDRYAEMRSNGADDEDARQAALGELEEDARMRGELRRIERSESRLPPPGGPNRARLSPASGRTSATPPACCAETPASRHWPCANSAVASAPPPSFTRSSTNRPSGRSLTRTSTGWSRIDTTEARTRPNGSCCRSLISMNPRQSPHDRGGRDLPVRPQHRTSRRRSRTRQRRRRRAKTSLRPPASVR